MSMYPRSCCRGIAKAGEPNNLLPLSPGMLYMDASLHVNLRRKQRRLVRDNPGVLLAVSKGAKAAVNECQHQFRNRRWNCSTRNFLRGKNLFGKIVDRGEYSWRHILSGPFGNHVTHSRRESRESEIVISNHLRIHREVL